MIEQISMCLTDRNEAHVLVLAGERVNSEAVIRDWGKRLEHRGVIAEPNAKGVVFTCKNVVVTFHIISDDNYGMKLTVDGKSAPIPAGAFMRITDRLGTRDAVRKYMCAQIAQLAPGFRKAVTASLSEDIREYGVWCGYGITIDGVVKYTTSEGIRGSSGVFVALVDNVPTVFDTDRDVEADNRVFHPGPHAGKPRTRITLTTQASEVVATKAANQRYMIGAITSKLMSAIHKVMLADYVPYTITLSGNQYHMYRIALPTLIGVSLAEFVKRYGSIGRALSYTKVIIGTPSDVAAVTKNAPAAYIETVDAVLLGILENGAITPPERTVVEHELTHAVTYNNSRYRPDQKFDSSTTLTDENEALYFLSPDEIEARIQEIDLRLRTVFDARGDLTREAEKRVGTAPAYLRKTLMKRRGNARAFAADTLKSYQHFVDSAYGTKWEPNIQRMIDALKAAKDKPAAERSRFERQGLIFFERGMRDLYHTLKRTYGPMLPHGQA